MATPLAIREAIATRLKTSFPDAQTTGYVLSNPTAPGFEIDIDPEGVLFDQAMGRGLDEWWFLIRGFVAGTTDIGSQKRRDEWLASSGADSVKAALETDRTLGGACSSLRVVSAQPRTYSSETTSATYTAAEWRVRVMATG